MEKGSEEIMNKTKKDKAIFSSFILFMVVVGLFLTGVIYGAILLYNETINEKNTAFSFCQSQGYDGGIFFEEDTDFYTIDCMRFVKKEVCYGDNEQKCITRTIKETKIFFPTNKKVEE